MAFRSRKNKKKNKQAVQFARQYSGKLVALVLLVFLCFVHLKTAMLEQFAFSGNTTPKQLAQLQSHPKALYKLGTNEYLINSDNEQALYYFTKAIGSLSLYIPAFLRKGEILAEEGKTGRAEAISKYVDTIAPDSNQWRWDRTMLAYSLEQHGLLAKNLSWFIENNRGKRRQALTIATSVWPDPQKLVEHVGIHNSPHVLHFFISIKALEKTQTTWEIIRDHNLTEETNVLRYINFLIHNNMIKAAYEAWNYAGPAHNRNNLVINHNLQNQIIGSGFDWRLKKDHRKLLHVKEDEVHVKFEGIANINFVLHQLIPISAGKKYSLSFSEKSKSLTTDQRPFWSVHGYKCDKFWNTTEMVESSSNWQRKKLNFKVPENCNALWLSLRRKKSFHFDNKIAGSYSVKNITLKPISERFSIMMQ